MTRVQINISSNPHTRNQISELEQHTGMTVTAIVTLAIDRLHQQITGGMDTTTALRIGEFLSLTDQGTDAQTAKWLAEYKYPTRPAPTPPTNGKPPA